ncbi:MAG TPA: hypothetical protein VM143_07150 [Acidimicrobiales bacterium]|nr:hypothetical protein [Acidimicrobiales bacterium]
MTALIVLHDIGDEGGGAPWRNAFLAAGWQGTVIAPDLPGHAGAPPPEGGNHEPGDAAYVLVALLAKMPEEQPVVVGIGANGWAAELAALAARATVVVLVDGTGAPWATPAELVRSQRDRLRALAADEVALAPSPPGAALDPRLRHGLPRHGSRRLAMRAAAALPVPLVVVETPAGPTPTQDAAALVAACPAGGRVVIVGDATPSAVASAVLTALDPQQEPKAG